MSDRLTAEEEVRALAQMMGVTILVNSGAKGPVIHLMTDRFYMRESFWARGGTMREASPSSWKKALELLRTAIPSTHASFLY